jgi:hypothetical protein
MATGGEIKKLLRPLLARRSDLVYWRRTICFVPFTRYLRGVTFVLPAYSKSTPMACFANQLCNGSHGLDGASFESARIPEDWKDDVEGTSRRLCDELEKDLLPKIEPVTSFEEHLKRFPESESLGAYKMSDKSRGIDFQFACNACTRGDFDGAEAAMIELLDPNTFILGVPEIVTEEHRFSMMRQERMAYFVKTLRKGRTEVLTLLHDWEAFSVKSMKLEKYWKPLPFPCEL